ncbi:MAG: TerD family protein [Magnetococcales bacterium]|nr:TerD family protein [Magnetococcales bacterium]
MAISLQKGQKISLSKEAGTTLTRILMGLGWDCVKKKGLLGSLFGGGKEVDLDASCLLFNASGQLLDAVWFKQLRSKDGSVMHTGDNTTGAGEGDDESIIVDLTRVPESVTALVFVVNSFTGQGFDTVANSFCRLVDHTNNREVARYQLDSQGPHTAMVLGKLYRHENDWKMHAIGEKAQGKTFLDLLPIISANL